MAVKQTAGRDSLGEFAPKFAQLNDDIMFGEVWSREDALSLRDRSLVTVVALMAQGLVDSSFRYHLTTAKQNGITRLEISEILTHAAFYAGWPKAWAAFRMAKEVWEEAEPQDEKAQPLPFSPSFQRGLHPVSKLHLPGQPLPDAGAPVPLCGGVRNPCRAAGRKTRSYLHQRREHHHLFWGAALYPR